MRKILSFMFVMLFAAGMIVYGQRPVNPYLESVALPVESSNVAVVSVLFETTAEASQPTPCKEQLATINQLIPGNASGADGWWAYIRGGDCKISWLSNNLIKPFYIFNAGTTTTLKVRNGMSQEMILIPPMSDFYISQPDSPLAIFSDSIDESEVWILYANGETEQQVEARACALSKGAGWCILPTQEATENAA